jgi:peroxiredoxin
MNSATTEQIDQALYRIISDNDHLPVKDHMAILKNFFLKKAMSPEKGREIVEWLDNLSRSGISDKFLKTGDSAPDFTLTNSYGLIARLKSRLKRGPVLVLFYRGIWCSFCNLYLKAIQDRLLDFRKLRSSVMAISPQTPDHSWTVTERYGLEFDILSDIGNMVARKFGLVHRVPDNIVEIYQRLNVLLPVYNGDDSNELPITGSFIINKNGKIVRAYTDVDFMDRPDLDEIIDILKALQ